MTNKIILVLICLSCYSCATLVNNKQTQIEIHTIPESATICLDNDSCIKSPIILDVPRSYNDFNIVVKNDSIEKIVRIKSKVAPEFILGNLLFVYFSPIAYIVDANSRTKNYSYENAILVDLTNTKKDYKRLKISKKNEAYFRSSLPWFDYPVFNNGRSINNYVSYIGLTVGLDYYYSKRLFLSLSGGATGIDDLAFPIADRYYADTNEFVKSYSAKLTNNYDFNVFSSKNIGLTMGLGLSLTKFNYKQIFYDTINNTETELYKNTISTAGLCVDANVNLFKYFYFGLSILPSVYTITRNTWEFSQLTYIEFGVRFPLEDYFDDSIKRIKYKPKHIE